MCSRSPAASPARVSPRSSSGPPRSGSAPAQLIVNTVAVNTRASDRSWMSTTMRSRPRSCATPGRPSRSRRPRSPAGMGDGGAIVAVSTIGAHSIQPEVAPYCASKAALDVLVRNLAYELGPRGIRVNAVAPGLVRTDMSRALWEGEQEAARGGPAAASQARAPAGHRGDDLLPAVRRGRLDHRPGARRRRRAAARRPGSGAAGGRRSAARRNSFNG